MRNLALVPRVSRAQKLDALTSMANIAGCLVANVNTRMCISYSCNHSYCTSTKTYTDTHTKTQDKVRAQRSGVSVAKPGHTLWGATELGEAGAGS